MNKIEKNVRVRFAPSPTGHLHIGGVRTAMFNWLFAKNNGGKYLLRVEDTDLQRSKKEYLNSQLDSLKWFDLLPDEPIVYQMSRVQEHKKVIDQMLDKGLAYPCFCDPDDLDKKRAEKMEAGFGYKYDGCCRNKKYEKKDLEKPHAIRFKIPENTGSVEFNDLLRGEVKVDIKQLDDFIIMRRDGSPTYNFVVVLDDIFMKISHVIRGDDHISNTPKQVLIYKALEEDVPKFVHLPLILGTNGKPLSKRDASVDVQDYKKKGFLAEALFNYLVRLGWSHGDQEIFTKEEIVEHFSFDHVGKKGAIFDVKKLEWLNGIYIRKASFEQLTEAVKDLGENYLQNLTEGWGQDKLKELFPQYAQRATTVLEMVQDISSFLHSPKVLDLSLIKKWRTEQTGDLVKEFADRLQNLDSLSHEKLVAIAKEVCKNFDLKLVNLAQPLRLALTGKTFSPGVFELIAILGKDGSVGRIKFLLKTIEEE